MSTNSLLHPPTTIQVGDIPTEVKANQEHAAFFGRENNNNTDLDADADTTMTSPDIDRVIKGFQHELDTLSRSFDLIATSHSKAKRGLSATTSSEKSSPNNNDTYETPAHRHEAYRPPDPNPASASNRFAATNSEPLNFSYIPPSRSRSPEKSRTSRGEGGRSNRSDNGSRSTKRTPLPTADETFTSHTTNATTRFEVPRPVDTPVLSRTSGANSRRYVDVDIGGLGSSEDRYNNLGKTRSSESLEDTVERMKERLNEQSYTIRRLQLENNDLRKQLLFAQGANVAHDPAKQQFSRGKQPRQTNYSSQRLEPMLDGSNRPRHNNHQDSNSTPRYNNYDKTPRQTDRYNYYYDEMKPMGSSLSTFPRDDEDENTLETTAGNRVGGTIHHTGFTPGTKFVAELTKFMTINQGHNVPLSVIIDKHWDKLKFHMREETNDY